MKMPIDLSCYLVTDRGALNLEQFLKIIKKSILGGVTIVQLREKNLSAREMISIGQALCSLLRPLSIPLIINDRVDIAHLISADGVHLGQSDLKVREARAILGSQAIIGLSVATIEQVIEAQDEEVDYLAASPVFHTQTKADCSRPWGLEGLKQACSISRHPVIAIGGINETNVEKVMAHGAVGVAVVSAIFNAPCPQMAAMALKNRMKRDASTKLG